MEGTDGKIKDKGQRTERKYRNVQATKQWAKIISIGTGLLMLTILGSWFISNPSMGLEQWKDVASIVGGVCGPLVAFAAALFFWSSIELQQIELNDLKEKQDLMRFEGSFFGLNNNIDQVLNTLTLSIKIETFTSTKSGRDALKLAYFDFNVNHYRGPFDNEFLSKVLHRPDINSQKLVLDFFSNHLDLLSIVEKYFLMFEMVLNAKISDKERYLDMIFKPLGFEGMFILSIWIVANKQPLDKYSIGFLSKYRRLVSNLDERKNSLEAMQEFLTSPQKHQ